MKKVINITLGNSVFAIEQDAFDTLSIYLEAIRQKLARTNDLSEIVEDMEGAIAEKFTARKRSEKSAVTSSDVMQVTAEMGSPNDFDEEGENAGSRNESVQLNTTDTKKRLYRDTDDVVVAGVASGVARYFEIDPVIVRLIFIFSVFISGFGILAYIILWLVVPAAETTTQKYAMRGEKMTLKEITERVKKKVDEVDTNNLKAGVKNTWGGIYPVLTKIFNLLGVVVRTLAVVIRYVVGFALVLVGAISLAGLVVTSSMLWMADSRWTDPSIKEVSHIILSDPFGYVFLCAVIVSALIPLIVLIVAGGSLLAGRNLFTAIKALSLGVVWIVAITLSGALGIISDPSLSDEIQHSDIKFQRHYNIILDSDGKFDMPTTTKNVPEVIDGNVAE
ncbi:MAG: PspC domain-containing protein [Candidatus Pacebacteria bacterium]|nr:PspC domain-containing protein [Candidatus Paceibacterota bacterium]MCF7857277.1 PspC domain-containing protein [Candidatus Paceibacterota bacterium]